MNDLENRINSSLDEMAVIQTPVQELDKRYAESRDKLNRLFEQVQSLLPEKRKLLNDLSDSITDLETDLQTFAYKRGFWEGTRFMARMISIYKLDREG